MKTEKIATEINRVLVPVTVTLLLLTFAMLLSGCASTKEERCQNYEAVYQSYLATTTADIRPISKEEAAAAAVAATFLRLHCGWVGTRGVDKNGVEIVVKP